MSDTRTIIESMCAIIEIDRNDPIDPRDGSGEVFICMKEKEMEGAGGGHVFGAIPADALRAAIDKAVGKREEPKKPEEEVDWRDSDRVEIAWDEGRTVVGRETVGEYVGQWVFPNGLHYRDSAVAYLNPKAVPATTPKPPRPLDDGERELLAGQVSEGERASLDRQRDRHLRHISDLEGTLARRNERHEKDQEAIREKDEQIEALGKRVVELEGNITALERLAAFVAAHGGTPQSEVPQPEVEKAVILDYLGAANNTHRYVLSVPAATDFLEHTGPYAMTLEER